MLTIEGTYRRWAAHIQLLEIPTYKRNAPAPSRPSTGELPQLWEGQSITNNCLRDPQVTQLLSCLQKWEDEWQSSLTTKTLTLPGQAVDNLWSDCARWILGLFTIWPTGSCSFFPANANCEKAVWYPGVSSMSTKCSSSGIVVSSGNSNRPIRDCNKGVLDWKMTKDWSNYFEV